MVINPDRKPKTMESRSWRKYQHLLRRERLAAGKLPKMGSPAICDGKPLTSFSVGDSLGKIWKAQRQKRLKARGGIRTPHTRQLWARYYRNDLPDRVFCL